MLRQLPGNAAAVVDVPPFLFAGPAPGKHAGFRQQRFQQPCGIFQCNAFVRQNLGHGAEQAIGVSRGKR